MKTISKSLISALVAALSTVSLSEAAFAQSVAPASPSTPASTPPQMEPPPPPAENAAPSPPDDALGSGTVAGPSTLKKDESSVNSVEEEKKESKLPFRGSAFIFDQSASTQTAHLDTSPQLSYVPVYEWWLSFRPRYYLSEKVYVSGRLDYYKEFTNSNQTTKYREDVIGDVWADLVYSTKVPAISKYTKAAIGARIKLPTSKESQDQGVIVQGGATASVKQGIPIRGESAKVLNDAHVGLSFWYNHPFTQATTGTNGSLNYTRQDTDGRSFISDQLSGSMLTNHTLVTALDTGLQITPKLSLTLDMILINNWRYTPKDTTISTTGGVPYTVPRSPNDTNFVASAWFLASIDYELIDELSLGLGYYSLANQLGPDGQRRTVFGRENFWWSPDARVFFDITANLDKIYEFASGKKTTTPKPPAKGFGQLPSSFRVQNAL